MRMMNDDEIAQASARLREAYPSFVFANEAWLESRDRWVAAGLGGLRLPREVVENFISTVSRRGTTPLFVVIFDLLETVNIGWAAERNTADLLAATDELTGVAHAVISSDESDPTLLLTDLSYYLIVGSRGDVIAVADPIVERRAGFRTLLGDPDAELNTVYETVSRQLAWIDDLS
jgi:hypothetical protein